MAKAEAGTARAGALAFLNYFAWLLCHSRQLLEVPKQQTEVEQQDDLETMSHTTGEDSSVADSQGLSLRQTER